MQNKDQILEFIISRFPNYQDCIMELFEESEPFRSLCKDYFDCKKVLTDSIVTRGTANDLRKEYQVMLSEIEDDLLERITK